MDVPLWREVEDKVGKRGDFHPQKLHILVGERHQKGKKKIT